MVKPSEISPNSAALIEKILGKYLDPVCSKDLHDLLNEYLFIAWFVKFNEYF